MDEVIFIYVGLVDFFLQKNPQMLSELQRGIQSYLCIYERT